MLCKAKSKSETSMSRPMPDERAATTAETKLKAIARPVIISTTDKPKRAGGVPGSPVKENHPVSACIR